MTQRRHRYSWVATLGTRVVLVRAVDSFDARKRAARRFYPPAHDREPSLPMKWGRIPVEDSAIRVRRATPADTALLDDAGGAHEERQAWLQGIG